MRILSLEFAYAHIRAGLGRVSLSIVAIALGVALVVAVHLMNGAVLASFIDGVDALAGRAALTVFAAEGVTIHEDLVAAVAKTDGVKLAVPLIRSVAFPDDRSGELLTVFGIDLTNEEAVRVYHEQARAEDIVEDSIAFLSEPDSIIVGREFATRRNLGRGSVLPLVTPTGVVPFTIRGLIEPVGLARALEGRLIVMDLFAAQRYFTAEHQISQIDVILAEGASVDRVKTSIAAVLPRGIALLEPEGRREMVRQMMGGFQAALSVFSILAVVAGLVICFGRFGAIFEARTWEVGLLRAVGLRQSTVCWELLKETLLVGIVGAVAGIPLGFAIARGALPALASTFAITFRGPSAATLGPVSVAFIMFGVGIGLLASLLAAIIPVLRLTRRKPVAALTLRGRDVGTLGHGQGEVAALILLSLSAALIVWQQVSRVTELGLIATGLIVLAATVGAGGLVRVAGSYLARAAGSLQHPTGEFAAGYFLRQPRRIATTVATVGIGLGAILMFGMLAWSTERTLRENLTRLFSADIVISSPFVSAGYRTAPLDDDIVEMVRNVAGVSAVGGILSTDIAYGPGGGIPPVLWSEDSEVFRNPRLHRWRLGAGALPEALNRVAEGDAVLVSTTFARQFNIVPGQMITLNTSRGQLSILVAGVTSASPEPAVYISRDQYKRWWHDETVSLVLVALNGGEGDEVTKAAIMRSIAGRYRVEMRSIPTLVGSFASQVRQVFGMLYLLQAITFVLIVIGVGDTLATEVLERMREFAVLRAVGLRRWRVFEIVMTEGLGIGVVGLALAMATGGLLGLLWVKVQFPALVEWQIDLYVPWGFATGACLIMLCVTALGALLPSLHAARVSVRDSLRNE